MSFKEAVKQISAVTGRSITFKEIPMRDYVEMLRSYQLPEDYIWLIGYLFTEVLDGRNESIVNDVEKITGRKPRSFETYAKQAPLPAEPGTLLMSDHAGEISFQIF